MASQDVITKRLHISGLTKDLTLDLVKNRFEQIGQVIDFTLPGKNALGDDQRFAYLEVKASRVNLQKCVNGLSGATWNNSKLRIADARPDWKQKLEKDSHESEAFQTSEENVSPNEIPKKKKVKKLPKGVGIEASNIKSPVTKLEVKSGEEWGWNLTPAGHMVRPLVLRPDHPIPKAVPLKNDPKLSARKDRKKESNSKEDEKKEKKASRKRKIDPNAKPPVRAKRVTLDPTRYGAQHLSGLVLDCYDPEVDRSQKEKGIWVCEDADQEQDEEGNKKKKVKWIHINQDRKGEELFEEEIFNLKVKANPKTARSELFDDLDGSANGNSDFEADEEDGEEEQNEGLSEAEGSDKSEKESEEQETEAGAQVTSSGGSSSSSSEGEVEMPQAPEPTKSMQQAANLSERPESRIHPPSDEITTTFQPLPFDPDSGSVFSEGYDETAQVENQDALGSGIGPSHDFDYEREKTKSWLSSVFGNGFLGSKSESDAGDQSMITTRAELVEDPEEDGEWDTTLQVRTSPTIVEDSDPTQDQAETLGAAEQADAVVEEPLTGARARRAALLAPALKTTTQRSFQPHARFDPGTNAGDPTKSVQLEVGDVPSGGGIEQITDKTEVEAQEKEKVENQDGREQVRMTSLKDMFKPQEEVKGFSLLGGLDLDLDEELDFLADDPDEDDKDRFHQGQTNQADTQHVSDQRTGSASNVYLFPQFEQNGKPKDDPRNFLSILSRPMEAPNRDVPHQGARFERDHHPAGNLIIRPQPFCRFETDEERKERWERNKKDLTAEYKRRHREAVKKKRRKVENGKAIPGRS